MKIGSTMSTAPALPREETVYTIVTLGPFRPPYDRDTVAAGTGGPPLL